VGSFVSKCRFCPEELAAGRPPVCVSACPNRAPDPWDLEELRARHGGVSRVFPLPDAPTSKRALLVKPHRSTPLVEKQAPEIANWEEV
jgi:anaerobic dimethyl sulfoxide reductase subunit B (iron-sulfur subunit)